MEAIFYQARGEQAFTQYEEPTLTGIPMRTHCCSSTTSPGSTGKAVRPTVWYYEFKDLDPGDEAWEDVAKINPVDGKRFGIETGDRIRLTSPTGKIECGPNCGKDSSGNGGQMLWSRSLGLRPAGRKSFGKMPGAETTTT